MQPSAPFGAGSLRCLGIVTVPTVKGGNWLRQVSTPQAVRGGGWHLPAPRAQLMTCRAGRAVAICSPAGLRGYRGGTASRLASVRLWTQLWLARLAPLCAGEGCPPWAEAALSVARGAQDGPRSTRSLSGGCPFALWTTRKATQRGPRLGDRESLLPTCCGARPGQALAFLVAVPVVRWGPPLRGNPHLATLAASAQVWSCCLMKFTTPCLPARTWPPPSPRPPCSGSCRDGS